MSELWRRLGLLLGSVGWLYALALLVAVASLWGFAELADGVLEHEMTEFNRIVITGIHRLLPAAAAPFVTALTHVGSVAMVVAGGALFGAYLAWRRRSLDAATLGVALAGGGLLTWGLKRVFGLTRPEVLPHLVTETSYSFPSGHTLMSFCLYGFIAIWVVARSPRERWRWALAAACIALTVAIGMSRIYLGVHWPTDVIAGFLAGAFWLAVCFVGRGWVKRHGLKSQVDLRLET